MQYGLAQYLGNDLMLGHPRANAQRGCGKVGLGEGFLQGVGINVAGSETCDQV